DENAVRAQIEKVNELRARNGFPEDLKTRVLLVAPNFSAESVHAGLDLYHFPGGMSFVRRQETGEVRIHLRGYTNLNTSELGSGWHTVDREGQSVSAVDVTPPELQVTDLITSRIRSLELARELWFEKFTVPLAR